MIEISVEVRSSTSCLRVGVRAENIQRALSIVGSRYPSSKLKVLFPIEPESFFVNDSGVEAGLLGLEMPEQIAG